MEPYFWLILIAVGVVVEALSPQLVSIWFVFGFIAAFIANLLGAPVLAQIIVAIVVSVLFLIVTKPFVKKIMTQKEVNTNADRNIGKTAVVTSLIPGDNLGVGRVEIAGASWAAYCKQKDDIPKGAMVIVEKIEGVKLLVKILED